MKYLYLTTIAFFILLTSLAGPINQVKVDSGTWNNSNTWSLGHSPKDGETVLVPANYTVIVDNNVKITSATLILNVYGTINFSVGKLDIGLNSIVNIQKDGKLTSKQGTPADRIEIGGKLMYSGSQGTIGGPRILSYLPLVLPVKFVAYSVFRTTNGISIQWTTEEEVQADKYMVERSEDGNNWKLIADIKAVGNSSVLNNYSYTDKTPITKLVHYRVKQVDMDGRFVYTPVKTIKGESEANVDTRISSNTNNVVVEFAKQIKGSVVVRLISLNGQVVAQKTYNSPVGYIVLSQPSLKGNYVVSITNGQDLKIAKQVIL